MKSTYMLVGLLAGVTLATVAGSASALLVNDIGDDFNVSWLYTIPNTTQNVTGTAAFDVTSVTIGSQVVFNVTLTNTTVPTSFKASLVSFGFYIDPDAISASITNNASGATWAVDLTQPNFPGGFASIDVCIYAVNNCQGGNINNGLLNNPLNNSDLFTLTLNGPFASGLSFPTSEGGDLNFPVKFQTELTSYEFAGNPTPTNQPGGQPDNSVPEPGTLSLLAAAILGQVFLLRRRPLFGAAA